MDKNKDAVFNSFIKKAEERLESKKERKTKTIYIPSMDTEIKVRNLTKAEIIECMDVEESQKADEYTCYIGVCEPDLKKLAVELKEKGTIKEYTDVVDIFDYHERQVIIKTILTLSGITPGSKTANIVEIEKN